MYEMLNVLEVAAAEKLNFPSMSVIVPVVVPLTTTVTPGIGDPSSPITVPDSDFCCAKEVRAKKHENNSNAEILQIPFNLLFFINFKI